MNVVYNVIKCYVRPERGINYSNFLSCYTSQKAPNWWNNPNTVYYVGEGEELLKRESERGTRERWREKAVERILA